MSFYDQVPCLDAFMADVQSVNESSHFEDLKLAVDSIFVTKENRKGGQNIKDQNNAAKRKPKASISRRFLRCFIIVCIGTGCLFSLPFICFETINILDMALNAFLDVSHLHSFQSDVLFISSVIFRKTAIYLRFQETFSVTDLDFDECILDNPLHKYWLQTPLDCKYCTEFDQPLYITADSTSATKNSLPIFQPMVFQKQGSELELEQLQQLLMKNTQMMNSDTVSLLSNRPYIKNVEDFLKEDIPVKLLQDGEVQIKWRSLSYLSAHILRAVVPQPYQFFENALRSYRSMINIDGPLSPPFQLHPSLNGPRFLLMFAQLSGSRRLVFSPAQDCTNACSSFTVVAKPKDVVIFNRQSWTVRSEAFEEDSTLSLSFSDEFDLVD